SRSYLPAAAAAPRRPSRTSLSRGRASTDRKPRLKTGKGEELHRIVISGWASQSAVGALLLSGSLVSEFEVSLLCCRGPGESGELVGERDGGFVVAETLRGFERPGPDGVGLALLHRGGEHGSCSVDQQHAQGDVA